MVTISNIVVSPDEFKEYTGVDLNDRLVDDGNPSGKAERFIAIHQSRLNTYLNSQFHRDIDREYYKGLTAFQQKHYKIAVIEHCLYIFKNGDIGMKTIS